MKDLGPCVVFAEPQEELHVLHPPTGRVEMEDALGREGLGEGEEGRDVLGLEKATLHRRLEDSGETFLDTPQQKVPLDRVHPLERHARWHWRVRLVLLSRRRR